jgi:hypothetical protein
MWRGGLVQSEPEVGVLHRLTRGGSPAIGFPGPNPAGHALPQVLGVGVEVNAAGLFQRTEGFDRGLEFHAIVGGREGAPADLTLLASIFESRSPRARAGISVTSAIRMNGNQIHNCAHAGRTRGNRAEPFRRRRDWNAV